MSYAGRLNGLSITNVLAISRNKKVFLAWQTRRAQRYLRRRFLRHVFDYI